MANRYRVLSVLGVLSLLAVASYYIYTPGPWDSEKTEKRHGFIYYLPVTAFVDPKWVRMNTVLSRAQVVCDSNDVAAAARNFTCDMTVAAVPGWGHLCTKTRAMFVELCRTRSYAGHRFIAKIDDDAIIDPLVEEYIETHYNDGQEGHVYFGTTYGPSTRYDPANNTWFGGWFNGFNTEVMDQICDCDLPECVPAMGEDQWTGYVLGRCGVRKRDLVVPVDLVHHKNYGTKRLQISFKAIRNR
ncbi:hypothetical protein H4R18_001364 [Coemansia javaensis]|uniref:Uncharacterized protein n=1 Tax=Coemansia javaensis TaxID=2761396 RepID=A0A9W8LLP9_9FUNG|nr:hypothetical protein H4R18_001364 [Coemansia javaensis]